MGNSITNRVMNSYKLLTIIIPTFFALKVDKQVTVKDEIDDLLTQHPVFDGHNDLPGVIRSCLSNTIYDGRYNFKTNLRENPQSWFEGCSSQMFEGKSFVGTD